jgi:hypothetical protein
MQKLEIIEALRVIQSQIESDNFTYESIHRLINKIYGLK